MTILIKNAKVLDMVGNEPNIRKLDVLIDNNKISRMDVNISDNADKVINASNKLIMPGFVNTHTHLAMSLFRGYKDERKLEDWLFNAIFPVEDKLTVDDIYYGSYLSCVEMIKAGTTTCNDMYFKCEGTLKALEETGMRGSVSWAINDNMSDDYVRLSKEYAEKYNKKDSRIRVISCFHAPYTCNPATVGLAVNLSKELNLPIHTHLSETVSEENTSKETYGKSSTEYMKDLGVFDGHVILAHGIHMSDSDIEILKNIKGGISTNPISNAKLASGICDVVKLRNNGINVGIGTDGQGSTTTLSIFDELRTCAYLQKLKYEDPTIIKSYDLLKMATIEGAKVLGLDNEIGTIEVGKKADLILIDLNSPNLWPHNDICTNLVFSGTEENINTVIIDGNILMEDRKLININEKDILNKIKECADRLLD